jgi:hypothetical protein
MYQVANNQGYRPRTDLLMRFPGRSQPGHQQARPDVTVGHRSSWRGPFGLFRGRVAVKGFAIDMNRNGRYDRGQDGVLTFDMNGDGRYDAKDVQSTNNMMKAASGNYDFDGDGRVSWSEKIMGAKYRQKYAKLDRNRDGKLSGSEIARGGGRVWVDRDRNGRIGHGETHSPFRIPSPGRRGPVRLDGMDPIRGRSHTSPTYPRRPGGRRVPGYPGFPQNPGNCDCDWLRIPRYRQQIGMPMGRH